MRVEIVEYDEAYAEEAVAMWSASKEKALGTNDASLDRYLEFLQNVLINTDKVFFALEREAQKVVGIMATNGDELNQLYIHPDYQRMGIGSQLMDVAKQLSPGKLSSRTFIINSNAQSFYEKHGLTPVGRDHNKCWGLDEIIYEWVSPKSV